MVRRWGGDSATPVWEVNTWSVAAFNALPACECRIHNPVGDDAEWTDGDRKLMSDVTGYGWHNVGITPRPGQPSWVFSVGVWHTLRFPEVAMFGLQMTDMGMWINAIGEQVRAGRPPEPGVPVVGVIEGFPVELRPVHQSWYRDLLGYGMWFYRAWFPVLQIVWPDRNGLFPWDEGAGERCRRDQPVLWRPAEEQPLGQWRYGERGLDWLWPDAPDRKVFVSKRITDEGYALTYVVHDRDGDWQFLDGATVSKGDVVVAHLGDMASRFPTANGLGDLPVGWHAWIGPLGDWIRAPIPR